MRTLTAVFVSLLLTWPGSAARALAADRPPNVLLIVADDLGYGELGCQGNDQVPTPNIDAIAKGGVRFTNGYVSGPYCSPTRAGLMTGRYQQRFGHEFNAGNAAQAPTVFGLSLKEKTLPQRLKGAGYATGMFGKWHLGFQPQFHPQKRGFDEFYGFLSGAHPYLVTGGEANPILRGNTPVDSIDHTTEAFAREAASFIDRNKDKPWFVYLPFNAVHGPLQSTQPYLDRFAKIVAPKRRSFAAMLAALDDGVGTVMARVREHKLESDTIVIFVSDNGGPTAQTTSSNGPLRGFKAQVWEGGVRVPFMMQWPGHVPAGQTIDQPVIQLDLLPTVLAAAGVKVTPDDRLDGVNLLPLLTGASKEPPHESLFWRFGKQRAVRSGPWKLTDMGEGAQLFNVADDIGETNDLAKKNPEKLKELETAYAAWNGHNVPPSWAPRNQAATKKAATKKAARKAAGR